MSNSTEATRYIPAAGRLHPLWVQPERPPRPATPQRSRRPSSLVGDPMLGPLFAVVACLLWVVGLYPISPDQLGGIGLIARLSVPTLLSYPLLVAVMVLELRYRQRGWLLGCYTLLGVVGVYGLQPAVQEVARLPVSWVHTGFVDYIVANGDVLHYYDARFSWQSFFTLAAVVTKASGLSSSTTLIAWAPVLFGGLAVLGVRATAVAALGNRPAAWLAPWIFLAANWTEQEYFSPQATAMILLLAALALTFRYLVGVRLLDPANATVRDRPVPPGSPERRLAVQGAVLVLGLALAPTHQLTPFVLGGLLLLLVLFGRLWPAWLPVVLLVGGVVWFALAGYEFWQGQLVKMILAPLGDVGTSVDQGIVNRFAGGGGRLVVLGSRVGLTLLVAGLAAAGILVMRRRSLRSWLLFALCCAPFGIAALQPYGGEVFIRCFLYSLPLLALPAAIALEQALVGARKAQYGGHTRKSVALVMVPVLVLTGFLACTITARGGNDAYTSFTKADIDAARWAVEAAPEDGRVDTLVNAVPLQMNRLAEVKQSQVDVYCPTGPDIEKLAQCVRLKGPDFLVLSGSQFSYLRIFYDLPPDWPRRFIDTMQGPNLYRTVLINQDAVVLQRVVRAGPYPTPEGG